MVKVNGTSLSVLNANASYEGTFDKMKEEDEIKKSKDKKEQLKSLLEESVKEFCEDTSFHGFGNLLKADNWIYRVVWSIIIVVSMGYCFYCKYYFNNKAFLCGFISFEFLKVHTIRYKDI